MTIDDEGVFKYILIECAVSTYKLHYVRGTAKHKYHSEIFDAFHTESEGAQTCKCLGGGKIEHLKNKESIRVFGVSETYGKADHDKTLEIIKRYLKYPQENMGIEDL